MAGKNTFASERASLDLVTKLGLLKQDNYDGFFKQYPDLAGLGYIMNAESLGALKYTSTQKYKHWLDENGPLPSFGTTAAVTGAAGATVLVTIPAADHLLAGTASPAAEGIIVEDDLTGDKYEVLAVNETVPNAFVVTLNPIKQAQTTNITLDSRFKFFGHINVKEASVKTKGQQESWTPTIQETATIRTDQEYTDYALFEHLVINGKNIKSMNDPAEDKRFIATQELQLMFGEESDNIKFANNRNTKALGLLEQIKAAGATYNAPTAGVVDEAFFRGLKRRQAATGLTNEFHALLDTEFTMKFDDFMNSYSANGGIIYASFNGAKETAINRNYTSFGIYNMSLHRKEYEYLNSARTHGAAVNSGVNKDTGIFIPQGTLKIQDQTFKTFNVRWQGESESDSIIRVVTDGAMFGKNNVMNGEVGHVTYKGIQAFQLQAYAYARL